MCVLDSLAASIVESASNAVVITNPREEGNPIVYVNPAFERITGYGAGEVLGKNWRFLLRDDQDQPGVVALRAVLHDRAACTVQVRSYRKDGVRFWSELHVNPILDADGGVTHVVAIQEDVTDRILRTTVSAIADAVLHEPTLAELYPRIHERIAELMPARNFYIALVEPDGAHLRFPYFCDERDETPGTIPIGRGVTAEVVRTGRSLLVTPDVEGELRARGVFDPLGTDSVDWLAVPLSIDGQTIGAIAVQSYDTSVRYQERDRELLECVSSQVAVAVARKRSEEERALLERALEGVRECVSITDEHDRIVYVNAGFLRTYGWTRPELVGKPIELVRSPDNDPALVAGILPATLAGGWHGELMNVRRDGTSFPVELTTSLVLNEVGERVALIGVARDVTERRRREEQEHRAAAQLLEARKEQELAHIAGMNAHTLNSALMAIMGNVQLAARALPPRSERIEELLHAALDSSAHAADIIRKLLAFSKQLCPFIVVVPVASLVTDGIARAARAFPSRERPTVEPVDVPDVPVDIEQFRSVVEQLVLNAYEATGGARGTIVVSVVRTLLSTDQLQQFRNGGELPEGPYLALTVRDGGIGMDADVQARMWDPFYTTHFEGRGLGLSSVLGMVIRHHGCIRVSSTPGAGTSITVYFPYR